MINSKEDLLRYLDTERLLFLGRNYGVNALARRKPKMKGEQEWKFLISLRNMEYWINVISKKGVLTKLLHFPNYYFHRKRYAKMRDTYCVQIPPNVFGEGLFIQHLHGIIISSNVVVGKYCRLFHNTTIGISVGKDESICPHLGDGITICAGAVIVGNVSIADDITVGANAVVTKSFENKGCAIGGVPARMIKDKAFFSMHQYAQEIAKVD